MTLQSLLPTAAAPLEALIANLRFNMLCLPGLRAGGTDKIPFNYVRRQK
jgi:hypothetical protein